MINLKYIFMSLMLFTLAACGGGNGSSGLSGIFANTGALSVMVTDDMTTQYSKVWVTVLEVTATDSSGQQHVLYEDPNGQIFNLTELHGITALLSSQDLIADTYSDFEIILANDISLVDKQGQTIQASFNTTGDPEVIPVQGSVSVTAGGFTRMGIDFDLKQFSYDQSSGIVSPVLLYLDDNQLQQISLDRSRIEGLVTEIIDAGTFTMENRYGSTVTVTLQATATIFDEYSGTVAGDTGVLTVAQKVEVFGTYDATTMTLDAVSARIDDTSPSSGSGGKTEIKGVISSFDGTSLVLDVRDSDFIPGSTTLEISNIANALFTKGSLDTLAAGQWVEIHGTWEDPVFTAMVVEIEGGIPRWDDGHNFDNSHHLDTEHDDPDSRHDIYGYVEIKGLVTALNGTTLSINPTDMNGNAVSTAATDINISNAWYKNGDMDCLTEGAYVEVKGANDINTGGIAAYTIEIQSPCGISI